MGCAGLRDAAPSDLGGPESLKLSLMVPLQGVLSYAQTSNSEAKPGFSCRLIEWLRMVCACWHLPRNRMRATRSIMWIWLRGRALLAFDQPDVNPDGSVDICFGPQAPKGKEKNWVQTVPGKGCFVWVRLYGPLEPFFEQTWRPDDIVKA
jgi:hypothetical protein